MVPLSRFWHSFGFDCFYTIISILVIEFYEHKRKKEVGKRQKKRKKDRKKRKKEKKENE